MQNTIPSWAQGLSIYEANIRQYTQGGTFHEFREHLPRLKELGVGIIWFMPVQPVGMLYRKGSLGSVYSISDYSKTEDSYGSMDEFKALVRDIHDLGMYVILDWVANHTAWDHVWVKTHPDFYKRDENGEVYPPFPDWSDVIGLDYTNPELRKMMISEMDFWLEAGMDGFRCDMAHLVPVDFWELARASLGERKNDIFMLAETEQLDLLEKAFQVSYDWKVFHELNELMKGNQSVTGLRSIIKENVSSFPGQPLRMRFISNHDENSWQGSEIERLSYGLEAFTVLYFTLPGMPLIYTGQEAGSTKRLSFFDKDCVDWKGDKMFWFLQNLIQLKRDNTLLWTGEAGGTFSLLETDHQEAILAYTRYNQGSELVVLLNLTQCRIDFKLESHEKEGQYLDIINGYLPVTLTKAATLSLQPWGYSLLLPI